MNSLVVVAIPEENDYIHKVSSEKIPHMTLLFLGEDVTKVKNLDKILDFVKHAADTSLNRFSLEVDHRGVLGPDKADVLFFSESKWSGLKEVNEYRSYLLKDNNIRTAYDSITQFPEWMPHITLGFPETPAKPDERDYPGIYYVNFDRIAVWFEEYSGVEFPLKRYNFNEDVAMSDKTNDEVKKFLTHVGIKGMKWGIRKERKLSSNEGVVRRQRKLSSVEVMDRGKKLKTSGGKGFPAHSEAIRAHTIGQIVKKSGTKAVSNEELQLFANRLQLEQNVSRLTNNDKNAGLKVSGIIIKQVGNKAIQEITGGIMSQVKKTFLKRMAT